MQTCPNCGASDKYPGPKVDHSRGYPRNLSTTYHCGTTTSPDWSAPVYSVACGAEYFYRIEENVGPGYILLNGMFRSREEARERVLLLFKTGEIPDHIRITKWRTGKFNDPVRVEEEA